MTLSPDDARRLMRYAERMAGWADASHSCNGHPVTLRGKTYRLIVWSDNPARNVWEQVLDGGTMSVNDLLLILELNEEAAK